MVSPLLKLNFATYMRFILFDEDGRPTGSISHGTHTKLND